MKTVNRYRYRVDNRLGSKISEPLGEAEFLQEWAKNSEWQVGYNSRMPSKMVITGDTFKSLLKLETSIYRCEYTNITVERNCSGTWVPWFTGRMSFNAGNWNIDGCYVEMTLDDVDPTECFEANKDNEIDIFTITNRQKVKIGEKGVRVETYNEHLTPGIVRPLPNGWCPDELGPLLNNDGTPNGYWYRYRAIGISDDGVYNCNDKTNYYAREYIILPCNQQPESNEWVLLTDTCPAGTRKYVRYPRLFSCGRRSEKTPANRLMQIAECSLAAAESDEAIPELDNGFNLVDVIDLFLTNSCPGITFKSDFFQIRPDVVSTVNYVTTQKTKTSRLVLFQKSDVKRPGATQNATKGKMSFSDLVENLCKIYNLRWILENNIFRLEHVSYYPKAVDIDLTQPQYAKYVKGMNKYHYNTPEIVAREEFKFMEASTGDFAGLPITYSGACVTKDGRDNVKLYTVERWTTDISLCMANPEPNGVVSDEGFCLVATEPDGTNLYIITEPQILSDNPVVNNSLAWAQLHRDYWRHDRPLRNGNMNGQPTTFLTVQPTKVGEKITFPLCCDKVFDPRAQIKTWLGIGTVNTASFSYKSGTITVELLYEADIDLQGNSAPTLLGQNVGVVRGEYRDILPLATDPDGLDDVVSAEVVGAPLHGTVTILTGGAVRFTPFDVNYTGPDIFTYRVIDSWGEPSNTVIVNVFIKNVATPPDARNDAYTTAKGVTLDIAVPGVLANDIEISGIMRVILYDPTTPHGGTVVVEQNGAFSYTPAPTYTGDDTFSYTIENDEGLTDVATVTITVRAGEVITVNDVYYTRVNQNVAIPAPGVLANDSTDTGTLACVPSTGSVGGASWQVFADGSFTFNPPPGASGNWSFPYTATNGSATKPGLVTVYVINTLYMRMTIGSDITTNVSKPGCGVIGQKKEKTFIKVSFYSDAAGTIPVDVTGMGVQARIIGTGYLEDRPRIFYDNYFPVSGFETFVFGGGVVLWYEKWVACSPDPARDWYRTFTLSANGYTVIT